jgi:hypothetical protein
MSAALNLLLANLSVNGETLTIFITLCIALIVAAVDIRLALMFFFLLSSVEYLLAQQFGGNLTYFTMAMFASIALLALSLMATNTKKEGTV